jgi:hypothetical protein
VIAALTVFLVIATTKYVSRTDAMVKQMARANDLTEENLARIARKNATCRESRARLSVGESGSSGNPLRVELNDETAGRRPSSAVNGENESLFNRRRQP